MRYVDYIQSEAWQERRAAALVRSERRSERRVPCCERCGRTGLSFKSRPDPLERFRIEGSNGLQVHHLDYRTLGHEEPDGLIVLCTDAVHIAAFFNLPRSKTRGVRTPSRVGCHELAHDDPAVRNEIARLARSRTY